MNNMNTSRLLEDMISYFEAGNRETDRSAKAIIEWDPDHFDYWQEAVHRLKEEGNWTGLRAPEAEMIAGILKLIQSDMQ